MIEEKGIMGKESDKDNGWMSLQKSVKKLHFGNCDEKRGGGERDNRVG